MKKSSWWLVSASLGLTLAAALPVGAAPTTISFTHCWGGFRVPVMQRVIDAFMQANPDIRVETKVVGCGDIHEQFTAASAGGVAPDVTMVNTSVLPSFVDSRLLLQLDPYLARDHVQMTDYVPSAVSLSTVGGHVYSLPTSVPGDKNEYLYYNTDHFEAAGISAAESLGDWRSLEQTAKKLTQFDGDGRLTRLGLDVRSGGDFNYLAWIYSNNGSYLSQDGHKVLLNNAKGKETLQWLVDFQQIAGGAGSVAGFIGKHRGGDRAFYDGAASMAVSGAWFFSYIDNNAPQLRFGAVQRPANDGHPKGVTLGGWSYGVSKESEHADAAVKLVEWLTYRKESVRDFTQGVQTVPALFSLLQDRSFWNGNPLEPYFDLVVQVVSSDVVPPLLPVENELTALRKQAFQQALSGDLSPSQALDQATQKMQAIVDDYWTTAS